jgi:glutamate receptor, ionotropic, invertebrate
LIRAFMTSMGIICQQGLSENFSKLSTRFLLYAFLVFSSLIFQFYSSFIVGSLLTDPPKTLNNVRQLIDSDLKVGIEDVSYNLDYFERTNDPVALELYRKKIKRNGGKGNFYEAAEGLKKVMQGGFAFHVDTSYGYRMIEETFSENAVCQLHEIFLYPTFRTAVSVAKNSKYREIVAVEFVIYKERGIESYHNMKWRRLKPKCTKSVFRIEAINFEEILWLLEVLIGSILIAFVTACIENLYYYVFERNVRQRSIMTVLPYID